MKCISVFLFVFLPFCTLAPGVQDGGLKSMFLCFFSFFSSSFDRTVTSAIHSTALPCQQDKTVVVKQSKQSPDGNKVPVV